MDLARIVGIVGLLFVAGGVLQHRPKWRNGAFIVGGICLFAYSINLGDAIFAVLELIFTASAIYDLSRSTKWNSAN